MEEMEKSRESDRTLEEFLAEDTENYTNPQKSISYKAYLYEESVLEAKQNVQNIEREIDAAHKKFDDFVKSIEETEAPSALAKISFMRKKKKLIADAEKELNDKLQILSHNLDICKRDLRVARRRLQEVINKLSAQDIDWNELKRIVAEKIAQGFFEFNSQSERRVREAEREEIAPAQEKLSFMRLRRRKTGGTGEGGRTFKEKNLIGKYDFYKLKGLTDDELREYQELLKHMLYEDEDCLDPQSAWMIRFALLEDKQRRLKNLALNTSNKALYNNVFGYFMRDGGMTYQRDFERLFGGQALGAERRDFFHDKAHLLMTQSGFSERFIARNCRVYERELEYLFSKPSKIKEILNRVSKNLNSEELISQEFEFEVKREVERRLQMKRNLEASSHRQAMEYGKK